MDDSYSDREFPDVSNEDLLVVMGSVHSVHDTDTIGSWIGREIAMVGETVDADRPVLGICFGGQVLSAALGGTVEAGDSPEIGWHTINSDQPGCVPEGPWFQWHYDRFSLPDGALELARNNHGIQAFQFRRSLGTQFHPEVTPTLVGHWLDQLGAEVKDKGVDAEALLAETRRQHPSSARRASSLPS